jgi:outer membrane protein assembly factor BamB
MAGPAQKQAIGDLVYIGLNRRVIALDRTDGHVVWEWKASKGSGFVSLLLDGDRLMVGVNGYIYCLDPVFGQVVWDNPLKGYGSAVTTIVSVNGSSDGAAATAHAQQQAAAAAASGGAAGAM